MNEINQPSLLKLGAMLELLAALDDQHEEERKQREHEPLFPEWETFPYE